MQAKLQIYLTFGSCDLNGPPVQIFWSSPIIARPARWTDRPLAPAPLSPRPYPFAALANPTFASPGSLSPGRRCVHPPPLFSAACRRPLRRRLLRPESDPHAPQPATLPPARSIWAPLCSSAAAVLSAAAFIRRRSFPPPAAVLSAAVLSAAASSVQICRP
jgi:hypothetical protein